MTYATTPSEAKNQLTVLTKKHAKNDRKHAGLSIDFPPAEIGVGVILAALGAIY
jgi:hypothetical protein